MLSGLARGPEEAVGEGELGDGRVLQLQPVREEQRQPRRGCHGQRPPVPQGYALLLPGREAPRSLFLNIFGGFFAERNWRIFCCKVP